MFSSHLASAQTVMLALIDPLQYSFSLSPHTWPCQTFAFALNKSVKIPYQENARYRVKQWNNPCLIADVFALLLKVPCTGWVFNLFHIILSSCSPGKAPDVSKHDRSAMQMCPQWGWDHFIGPSKHWISVQAWQFDQEQSKSTEKLFFVSWAGCGGKHYKIWSETNKIMPFKLKY